MRRPNIIESVALIAAAGLLWLGVQLEAPAELNRLWVYRGWAVKGVLVLAGLGLGLFSLISLRSPRSRFSRELLQHAALLAGSLALAAGLGEGLLRLRPEQHREIWTQPDPILHHAQKPGWRGAFVTAEWDTEISINEHGLRDAPLRPRGEVDRRVLIVGDSFAWGYGVEREETFSERLEARLAAEGKRVDVVNAGVISYSPILEWLYLREKGLALDPDLVIVAVDMSDLQDDLVYEAAAVYEGSEIVGIRPQIADRGPLIRFFKSLRLVRRLRSLADGLYARYRSGEEDSSDAARDLRTNRFALTRDDIAPEEAAKHWSRTAGYLEKIQRLLRREGVPMLLMTYPYGHQVSGDEWALGRHHYGFAADRTYGDHPERFLRRFAETNEIPFLGLFEAFRQSGEFPLYFPRDGHLTVAGHRLVAAELGKALSEGALLP